MEKQARYGEQVCDNKKHQILGKVMYLKQRADSCERHSLLRRPKTS